MPRLSSQNSDTAPKMDIKNIIMIIVFIIVIAILVYMIYKQIKKENYQTSNTDRKSQEEIELMSIIKDDYPNFVKRLGQNLLDNKFIDAIKSLSHLNKIQYVDIQPQVKQLIPTQNEIIVNKSLSWPLTNPEIADLYLKGGTIAVGGLKISTCQAGTYIIDGHHRWAQLYVLNPEANIEAVDFKNVPDPVNALKAVQLGIAADIREIPTSNFIGINLLDKQQNDNTRAYIETILSDEMTGSAVVAVFAKHGKGNTIEEISNFIMGNIMLMQQFNNPMPGATARNMMPQSDDAPNWREYAPAIENFETSFGPVQTRIPAQVSTFAPATRFPSQVSTFAPATRFPSQVSTFAPQGTLAPEELLKAILKDNYEVFVRELGIHIKDPKFVEAIKSLSSLNKINYKYIQPAVGPQIIPDTPYLFRGLVPTQNEVDMTKSLAYPLTSASTAELYLKGGNIAVAGKKIVTSGDGKYIIDGHHRWSQVYVVNPNANILALDLSDIPNPVNALKATQLGIGADLGKIPIAVVKGTNLLDESNNTQIYKYIMETMTPEVLDVFIKYGKGNTKDEVAGSIMKNVLLMQTLNRPIFGASKRDIMPQTDDAINWQQFAPRVEGYRNTNCSRCV